MKRTYTVSKAEKSGLWYAHKKGGFEMYVTNPWSGARVKITEVTQEQLDAMAQLMDDEVREQIHRELAPCTPTEFFRRYIELVGEDEAGKVWFS